MNYTPVLTLLCTFFGDQSISSLQSHQQISQVIPVCENDLIMKITPQIQTVWLYHYIHLQEKLIICLHIYNF